MPSDAITAAAASSALPAGTTGPVTVKVVSGGENLPNLPDGATLEAQATMRAVKGVIEMTTPDGNTIQVKVQANTQLPPIPPGAKLLLQAQTAQDGEMMMRLLAINGRPLAGSATMTQLQGNLPVVQQAGGGDMAGLLGQQSRTAQAGGTAANAQGIPQATPDSPVPGPLGLGATIIRTSVQAAANAQSGNQTQTGSGGSGGFGGNPQQNGGLPYNLPVGTTFTVRIATVGTNPQAPQLGLGGGTSAPHGGAAATITLGSGLTVLGSGAGSGGGMGQITAAPSPLLDGTVISSPANGRAIIQSPIGTLSIPSPGDLEPGTRLFLEVVGEPILPQGQSAAQTSGPRLAPLGVDGNGWPALTQSLDTLNAANQPQALEQLLRILPQANPRLAAAIVAFSGSMRSGDTKPLALDGVMRGLEKAGRKDLAQQLKGDLEALTDQNNRPVAGGDWRAYTVPFLNGGIIEPIRLFVRGAGEDQQSARTGGTGNDQRFVVDIDLSRLGRLQLDGLVRREDKLFDLIIRTGEPLPQEIRLDILGIFAAASELVGTKGGVAFQAGGRWMEFPPAPPAPTRLEA